MNLTDINLNAHLFLHGFILIAFAIFLLIANVFLGYKRYFSSIISATAIIFAIFIVLNLGYDDGFNKLFVFDTIAKLSSIIILSASLIFILCEKELDGDFYALFLFMIANFIALVSTSNLAVMFISLEASSLALFTLIALKNTKNAIRASLKYFIYSGISASFFCLAAAFYYFQTKSLTLDALFDVSMVSFFTFALFLIPIAFKLSLAPFHLWLEDVYKNANENLSGYVSVVPKMAMFAVALRIFYTNSDFAYYLFYIPCIFAMVYSSILALRSSSFKEVLVYSSLSNSAFVFTIITINLNFLDLSLYSIMFYWGIFTFINMALFLFLHITQKDDFKDFAGFLDKNKCLGSLVIFLVLSLGAIPPFGLFFPKVALMLTNASSNNIMFVIALAISSAIMIVAYAKIIKAIAFTNQNDTSFESFKICFSYKIVLFLGVIAGIFAVFGMGIIEYLI